MLLLLYFKFQIDCRFVSECGLFKFIYGEFGTVVADVGLSVLISGAEEEYGEPYHLY